MKKFFKISTIALTGLFLVQNIAYADKNQYVECPPVDKVMVTEDGANALYTARYADKYVGYTQKLNLLGLESLKIIKVEPRNFRVVCSYNAEGNQKVNLVLEKKFDDCTQKDKQSAVCNS
jgi:hypothetical protein